MSGDPVVFLDRDGTIIVERDYLSDPAGVALEVGAARGLRALSAAGFRLVVLTNQSGIARGYFDLAAAEAVNRRVADLLAGRGVAIDGWYVCPHAPSDGCGCRKPRPGLAHRAAAELGLALAGSWVVGDKRSDVELADAIGASGILVASGHGAQHVAWARAHGRPVVRDLAEAADLIGSARAGS
ncbi:D-glycero-alpha-D-manno-heptose-1,7-bisphosphate 7-phosphatase [Sphingomonas bacterium]|uniref:D-glycero-alpha-D-manno-heptose-1,7-bisphosphate 7-phosphatase n=1 Tax=Sphingomonas bacterium TaxID=1895847 RepID=UPI001575E6D3|nr:HAD family hydrolase [Sphingomonas bacterium]